MKESSTTLRTLCYILTTFLLLSSCSTIKSIKNARVSASSTAAVAANIPVCEVTTTGAVERRLGQQVEMFFYEHNNDSSLGSSYGCYIYSFVGQKGEAEGFQVKYQQKTALDEVDVPALYDAHTYAEAAALERATRFTLNGIPGEGVTIPLETGNWAAVWRYPDTTILTVLIKRKSDVEKIASGGSIAKSITELFAPHVPQVAAGPTRKLTFYPPNEDTARVLGIHDGGATPLKPWPSPSP
ncbi:hypothetical protein [Actinomyces oris]|uniref:hypothetical protein n=1 Tax=Actinomyces oris TaxID=544580 RepID=UPI0028D41397|nr:hypothetical protein [Actinomyces oris]